MRRTKRIKPETTFADEVLHGLDDFFAAVKRGDPVTVRTVRLDLEPRQYSPDDVRKVRLRLGASQAIFAQLVAVSVDLVQKWERGDRIPQPVHCRLLDGINANPRDWLRRLTISAKSRLASRQRRRKAA